MPSLSENHSLFQTRKVKNLYLFQTKTVPKPHPLGPNIPRYKGLVDPPGLDYFPLTCWLLTESNSLKEKNCFILYVYYCSYHHLGAGISHRSSPSSLKAGLNVCCPPRSLRNSSKVCVFYRGKWKTISTLLFAYDILNESQELLLENLLTNC